MTKDRNISGVTQAASPLDDICAGVYLLDNPYYIDSEYTYYIPSELRESVRRGSFVTVPFGVSNRKRMALVWRLGSYSGDAKLKPILAVSDDSLTLDEEMLGLAAFMKEQTLCTVGEAVHAMIPSAVISKLLEYYKPADNVKQGALDSLSSAELFVYEYICRRKSITLDSLKAKFGASVAEHITKLRSKALIIRDFELSESKKKKFELSYSLAISAEDARLLVDGGKLESGRKLTSVKQKALIAALIDTREPISEEALISSSGVGRVQIKALLERGYIAEHKKELSEDGVFDLHGRVFEGKREYILNDIQKSAYDTLVGLIESGEPKAALLHGVTGSGKTCVMIKTIDRVLESGRSAILLLPEISLTPQTVRTFYSYYGDQIALIHSSLSAGERYATYNRIKRGEAKVVIGTRSAVFAPVRDLGIIIIDEEQEHTYKSDNSPKYHARDIARYRCAHNRALMLLASATPSLESYEKAESGKYTLIKLTERFGEAELPEVLIYDMRQEAQSGNTSPIGRELLERLAEIHKKKEQSVLFINRRGYNNFVSCRMCGEVLTCPSCSVSLTYHTYKNSYDKGYLACHFCGYRAELPRVCPSCSSEHLSRVGFGTQRIEEEISSILPDAKIIRMDTDTTGTKDSYERMLGDFRDHSADILLGTQMVTKGHDFPDVTLVGVLLADSSLYLDDYRAAEKTFSLLTQVIGRAGRSKKRGYAIIQTNNPDSDVIGLACRQDYEEFYRREIKLRRALTFPPYCDIVLLTVMQSDENELLVATEKLNRKLREMLAGAYSDVATVIFGPFEAPVYRVEGRYRMRMVIKCKLNKRSRELFSKLLLDFYSTGSRKATLSIDFNPSSL